MDDNDELLRVSDNEGSDGEIFMADDAAGGRDDVDEGPLVPDEPGDDDRGDGHAPDGDGDARPVLLRGPDLGPREPPNDGDFSFVDAVGHVFAVTYRPSTPTQKARWQCRCLAHEPTKTRRGGKTFCTATVQIDEEEETREDAMNYVRYWCDVAAGAHMRKNTHS